jgi:hypothetical protein
MGYKNLTHAYPGGYAVKAAYTGVSISSTGYVGGSGLTATTYMRVLNSGTLTNTLPGQTISDAAVYLEAGGIVRNASTISGLDGIEFGSFQHGAVFNFGEILSSSYAVDAEFGACNVSNYGLITGHTGIDVASGSIKNLGTIEGKVEDEDGIVTNGATTNTTAVITGFIGVLLDGGTLFNYGHVTGAIGYGNSGVSCDGSGNLVINGASSDTQASITGRTGVYVGTGTLSNFGTITGSVGDGIDLTAGAATSGAATDQNALVSGANGISAKGLAAVVNFGTVVGTGLTGEAGVVLAAGGTFTNGSVTDTGALTQGYEGVSATGAAATITNFGAIKGMAGGAPAISLAAGGSVVNGAFSDSAALIDGVGGISFGAAGSVANFGTIDGESAVGVNLNAGGQLKNGSATDRDALILGYIGVNENGAGSIANFGTIRNLADTFEGALVRGGTITNGSVADTSALVEGYSGLYLSGAAATNFGILQAQGGPAAYGAILAAASNLTNRVGAVVEGYTGVLVSGNGRVTNFGTISGLGGTAIRFGSAADELVVEAGSTFTGQVLGDGGTLILGGGVGALAGLFSATGVTVSGSMAATTFKAFNTVETAAGAAFTVSGVSTTIAAGRKLVDLGALTLSGAVANAGQITLTGGVLTLAGTGLTVSGAGAVLMNAATSEIIGAAATSKLTLGQTLSGEGLIGGGRMALSVLATGAVKATGALTIDTAASVIANAGLISAAGGAVTVMSAVDNTGTVSAASSVLTLEGAVTGNGVGVVGTGTLDIVTASFSQNVIFTGTGTLELTHGKSYTGSVSGFSTTGANNLDLADVAWLVGTAKATASYTGTATGGTLTVKNGGEVDTIKLIGNYLSSSFVATSDGHGGTLIKDPPKAAADLPSAIHPFISAMAEMGAGAGQALAAQGAARSDQPILAMPAWR